MFSRLDYDLPQDLVAGLYIVATPIGNMGDITLRAIATLRQVDVIACEDTRTSGKLTSSYGISAEKMAYHEHNAESMRPKIVKMIQSGKKVALISDAGMPLISDPGYKLVNDCYDADVMVTCVPGASASLTGLVLSGLPSDRFFFHGFLPPKSSARQTVLESLKDIPTTIIFYETPPRVLSCLEDILTVLGNRPVAVTRELTKKFEEIKRGSAEDLIAYYADIPTPKGEIVMMVGARDESAVVEWTDTDIDAALLAVMRDEGLSAKDAAKFVAAKSNMRRQDVYQRAIVVKHRLTRED